MSQKIRRHTATFAARDDGGTEYVVHLFTDFIVVVNSMGREEVPGLKSLKLDDGRSVNRVEKGVYEIVSHGGNIRITSDDPAAP